MNSSLAAVSEELTHIEYWATRQQLLSGKVVVDWLDLNYGPMDPIFGVLLNPTLGQCSAIVKYFSNYFPTCVLYFETQYLEKIMLPSEHHLTVTRMLNLLCDSLTRK